MGSTLFSPTSVCLNEEQCSVTWGVAMTDWRFGQVIVDGCPIAGIEWYCGKMLLGPQERAATALRSFRASGGRWSVVDRRSTPRTVDLDLERELRTVNRRSELTWHRHGARDYWCLESTAVDAAFKVWDAQLARAASRRIQAAGGDLFLAGEMRTPTIACPAGARFQRSGAATTASYRHPTSHAHHSA